MILTCAMKPHLLQEQVPAANPVPHAGPSPQKNQIQNLIEQNSPLIEKYCMPKRRLPIVKGSLKTKDTGEWSITYDLSHGRTQGQALVIPYSAFQTGRNKHGLVQGSMFWKPPKDLGQGAPGILLSFDDRYIASWKSQFPLFDRYGAKVTLFIKGPCKGTGSFCTEALKRGHEIGFHTLHHLDLRRVSKQVFLNETLEGARPFIKAGVPLDAFAYPYGFSTHWTNQVLLKHYRIVRTYGVNFHLYQAGKINRHVIASCAVDNLLFKNESDFENTLTLMLRTAKFVGGILPLTSHIISASVPYGISSARLTFLLKTAAALHLRFYRYEDFCGK
jgi:peptidoglycan/xylan/chitin deacetylase (PgdA/CDA1 family)